MKFADVIVPLGVDGVFTYTIPESLERLLEKGMIVIVPFGGSKRYTGIVCNVHQNRPDAYEPKAIESIAEHDIRFSDLHLRFLLWISEYYMANPGDVMRAALPAGLRLESYTAIRLAVGREENDLPLSGMEAEIIRFLHPGQYVSIKEISKALALKHPEPVVKKLLNAGYIEVQEVVDEVFKEKREKVVCWKRYFGEGELNVVLDALKRAPVQYAMLCKWISLSRPELRKPDFFKETENSPSALSALCERGILSIEERKVSRLELPEGSREEAYALSEKQEKALQEIFAGFHTHDSLLFQGVTSSGKTEVYIQLIKHYLEQGKQVLYLLPEIALTVQIIRRLKRVFGNEIGIYHSGMPDNLRSELWKKQCGPQPYRLILGVRSSIFLPYTDLGLIVVDEEHDVSYKQKEPAPRYHARDAAVMLAKLRGAKILLGSATPSFESFENVKSDKYAYVYLDQRYGEMQLPRPLLADLTECRRKKLMKGSFTPVLYEAVKRVLGEGKQVILFQNRKGYSTYMQCDACGTVLKCKHCDVSMTYYKQRDLLVCRYCGSLEKQTVACKQCGNGHYKLCTPGTERIEEEVKQLFPDARVLRMDMDVMNSRFRYRAVIEEFEKGNADILIGTQMVSKGLDFARVKLVGVLDADQIVNFPDFRAEERAYAMLMQVSGRSGRKGDTGEVIIQTSDVTNRVFAFLQRQDYGRLFEELASERKFFGYPPYFRLIRVELRYRDVGEVRRAANLLVETLGQRLGRRVFGPAVPEVGRINKYYRVHIMIKVEQGVSYSNVKQVLREECNKLLLCPEYKGGRIVCDVDPF